MNAKRFNSVFIVSCWIPLRFPMIPLVQDSARDHPIREPSGRRRSWVRVGTYGTSRRNHSTEVTLRETPLHHREFQDRSPTPHRKISFFPFHASTPSSPPVSIGGPDLATGTPAPLDTLSFDSFSSGRFSRWVVAPLL